MKMVLVNVLLRSVVSVSCCAAFTIPASALTIVPNYDATVTSSAAASQIETAFNSVAGLFDQAFGNPVTVYVGVSWGKVNNQALPASAVGASSTNLNGYFTYAEIKKALTAAAAGNPTDKTLALAVHNLPAATPSGQANYVVSAADARALGLAPANAGTTDGYIGFAGSTASFAFTPGAVTSATYDFQAVAAHELSEVLGRFTGVTGNAWRTPLDLYRYSAPGVLSYSNSAKTYFSIDGGATRLNNFNANGGGDRGDWATSGATSDSFDAYIAKGQNKSVSVVDLAVLDAMGWSGSNPSNSPSALGGTAFSLAGSVPEPASWTMMIAGFGLVGAARRRQAVSAARVGAA